MNAQIDCNLPVFRYQLGCWKRIREKPVAFHRRYSKQMAFAGQLQLMQIGNSRISKLRLALECSGQIQPEQTRMSLTADFKSFCAFVQYIVVCSVRPIIEV